MFDNTYTAVPAIRKFAKIISIAAIVFLGLSIIAALIILGIDADDLWFVSLIVLGSNLVITVPLIFFSHMTWGFSEIIENTKKIADGGSKAPEKPVEEALPEL